MTVFHRRKIINQIFTGIVAATLVVSGAPNGWAKGKTAVRPLSRGSILLQDAASGKTLYSRNASAKRPAASTIKLMTALVAMEEFALDQVVVIPAGVEGTPPSRINLHTGEQIRVRDLLKAVLVGSANDAARALAIAAAGSEWSFVSRMNEKAAQIGMRHTRFMNASGLPVDNHYTTAADLILLMKAAQQNEFIVRALNAKYVVVQTLGGRMIRLKNHNRMLWRGPSEIIGKTGWTRSSDHCFVGRIRFGSKSAYVAIMGSRNKWNDLAALAGRYLGAKSSGTQKSSRYDTRSVQRALRKAGYFDREPTGFFGPITKNALIQFQKAHNLKPDGVVGPKTWKVLQKYL